MLGRGSGTEKEQEGERQEKVRKARKRAKTHCNKGERVPHQATQPVQKAGPERGLRTHPRAGGGGTLPKPGRRQEAKQGACEEDCGKQKRQAGRQKKEDRGGARARTGWRSREGGKEEGKKEEEGD